MPNYSTLKAAVAAAIKENGNQEITGQLLQNTLTSVISTVGENATFVGTAIPTTNPGTFDGPIFYFATQPGTYSNFSGQKIATPGLYILLNKTGSWQLITLTTWANIVLNVPDNSIDGSSIMDETIAPDKLMQSINPMLIGEIGLSDLDTYFSGEYTAITSAKDVPVVYKVMHNTLLIGILSVFSDDSRHILTQVFQTHAIPNNGVFDGKRHSDDVMYVYFRSYSRQGTTNIPAKTWTPWKEIFNSSLRETYSNKFQEIDADIARNTKAINKNAEEINRVHGILPFYGTLPDDAEVIAGYAPAKNIREGHVVYDNVDSRFVFRCILISTVGTQTASDTSASNPSEPSQPSSLVKYYSGWHAYGVYPEDSKYGEYSDQGGTAPDNYKLYLDISLDEPKIYVESSISGSLTDVLSGLELKVNKNTEEVNKTYGVLPFEDILDPESEVVITVIPQTAPDYIQDGKVIFNHSTHKFVFGGISPEAPMETRYYSNWNANGIYPEGSKYGDTEDMDKDGVTPYVHKVYLDIRNNDPKAYVYDSKIGIKDITSELTKLISANSKDIDDLNRRVIYTKDKIDFLNDVKILPFSDLLKYEADSVNPSDILQEIPEDLEGSAVVFDHHSKGFLLKDSESNYYREWKWNGIYPPSSEYGNAQQYGVQPYSNMLYIDLSSQQGIYRSTETYTLEDVMSPKYSVFDELWKSLVGSHGGIKNADGKKVYYTGTVEMTLEEAKAVATSRPQSSTDLRYYLDRLSSSKIRVNLPLKSIGYGRGGSDGIGVHISEAFNAPGLEVLDLRAGNAIRVVTTDGMINAFRGAKIHTILGVIDLSNSNVKIDGAQSYYSIFGIGLRNLKLAGLHQSIMIFSDVLSGESIKYMLKNRINTNEINFICYRPLYTKIITASDEMDEYYGILDLAASKNVIISLKE